MQNIRHADVDSYPLALGKIISNLHSLEVILRLFLHNVDKKRYSSSPSEMDLNKINIGVKVPENYFTNYDTLGELIKKYNELLAELGEPKLSIDGTLVRLRDALAHGRVLGSKPEPPYRLYKFGKPTKKQVPIIDVIDLTEARLRKEIGHVFEELTKAKKACEHFCPTVVG